MIIESCPLTAASMFVYRQRTAKRRSKRSQWLLSVNGPMVKGIIHNVRNFYCHAWHLRHRNEQPTTGQSLLLSRYTIRRRERLIFRIVVMRPPAARTVVCTPVVSVKRTLARVFISSYMAFLNIQIIFNLFDTWYNLRRFNISLFARLLSKLDKHVWR